MFSFKVLYRVWVRVARRLGTSITEKGVAAEAQPRCLSVQAASSAARGHATNLSLYSSKLSGRTTSSGARDAHVIEGSSSVPTYRTNEPLPRA